MTITEQRTASEPLLGRKELAEAVGCSPFLITAHCSLGYKFEFGRKTTRRHYLAWLKANRDAAQSATVSYRRQLKDRKANAGRPPRSTADK